MNYYDLTLNLMESFDIYDMKDLFDDYRFLINMRDSGKINLTMLHSIELKYIDEINQVDNIRSKKCSSKNVKTYVVNKDNSLDYINCLIDHLFAIMRLRTCKKYRDDYIEDIVSSKDFKFIYEVMSKILDKRN